MDNISTPQQRIALNHKVRQNSINDLEIYLPIKNGLHKLMLRDIICCATGGNGITFRLVNEEEIAVSKTLTWVEEQLSNFYFFRTHDSYLVNLLHVKKIIHVREGAEVMLSDNRIIEVSKRRKASFLKIISDLSAIDHTLS